MCLESQNSVGVGCAICAIVIILFSIYPIGLFLLRLCGFKKSNIIPKNCWSVKKVKSVLKNEITFRFLS